MYRFPKHYDKIIQHRFEAFRGEAFDYFLKTRSIELAKCHLCLDLACGTGLTSVAIAAKTCECRVIGIDQNIRMLAQARQRARDEGLEDRCRFVEADVHNLSVERLAPFLEDDRQQVDLITCALGFSVIPDWERAFHQANALLKEDGLFVIFDEYTPQLYVPEFDANQSRRSWELVEEHFEHTEVKWHDPTFIAIGQNKKGPTDPVSHSRS